MTDKTIVITGANSGIGFESTRHFSKAGWRVIMACRSLNKAESAREQILAENPSARLDILALDVSNLQSIEQFAKDLANASSGIDILINNAGIVAIPFERNADGHELQLATNYLGAFALTGRLLPMFKPSGDCRIVNVGSLAHRLGKLNIEALNWDGVEYHQWKAYANSKLAMMSHTLELHRRLFRSGSHIIALGAHPGFANTNIHQNSPTLSAEKKGLRKFFSDRMQSRIPGPDQSAKPIIMAAESGDAKGGDYYGPTGFLEIAGPPGKAKINKLAKDQALAERLWAESERLTGVRFLS